MNVFMVIAIKRAVINYFRLNQKVSTHILAPQRQVNMINSFCFQSHTLIAVAMN